MPRKFGNEIRLPGTTGIDNLPNVPYIKRTTSMTLCMALISEGLYVWNTTRHSWLSSDEYHK